MRAAQDGARDGSDGAGMCFFYCSSIKFGEDFHHDWHVDVIRLFLNTHLPSVEVEGQEVDKMHY